MKTQIIQLEPHDDVISVRDKLGWVKTGRVVLVWPEHGRLLTRKIDLVSLQRQSLKVGAQLALVTVDREISDLARDLKIPVFSKLEQVQDRHWRVARRRRLRLYRNQPQTDLIAKRDLVHPPEPAWLKKPLPRLGFFLLGVISFFAIIVYLLPGASINLTPKIQVQEVTLQINASPRFPVVNLNGQIPAYMHNIIVEGRESISTTGVTKLAESFASGYIRLTNLTENEVEVAKGTIVSTLPNAAGQVVRFEISSAGRIPAGSGQNISLPVHALLPGKQGNLPPDSLVAVEGALGLQMSSTNLLPTNGGTERQTAAPAPQDYERLYQRLFANLQQSAVLELNRQASDVLIPITSTLALSTTLKQEYYPPLSEADIPTAATQLTLMLRLSFSVVDVSTIDIQQLAQKVLDANLAKGFHVIPTSVQLVYPTQPKTDQNDTITWTVVARRMIQADLDVNEAIRLSVGGTPQKVNQVMITKLPLNSPPIIALQPAWWPRLPLLPFRIKVNIQQ